MWLELSYTATIGGRAEIRGEGRRAEASFINLHYPFLRTSPRTSLGTSTLPKL
jgi:hypothetical protein